MFTTYSCIFSSIPAVFLLIPLLHHLDQDPLQKMEEYTIILVILLLIHTQPLSQFVTHPASYTYPYLGKTLVRYLLIASQFGPWLPLITDLPYDHSHPLVAGILPIKSMNPGNKLSISMLLPSQQQNNTYR